MGRDEVYSRQDRVSDPAFSTFHAVEFSKTAPLWRQQKASDSHQRLSRTEHKGRIRSLEGSPVVELQASCTLLPEGGGMVAQEVPLSTKPFFAPLVHLVTPTTGAESISQRTG